MGPCASSQEACEGLRLLGGSIGQVKEVAWAMVDEVPGVVEGEAEVPLD